LTDVTSYTKLDIFCIISYIVKLQLTLILFGLIKNGFSSSRKQQLPFEKTDISPPILYTSLTIKLNYLILLFLIIKY